MNGQTHPGHTNDARVEGIVESLIAATHSPEELEQARKMCAELAADDASDPNACIARGAVDFILGRKDEAEAWMEKAAMLAPRSPAIFYVYAVMLLARKKFTVALLLLMRVVALRPDHPRAYAHMGNALRETGQFHSALIAFDVALKINPKDIGALNGKGNVLKQMDCLAEAEACFQEALAVKPGHTAVMNNLAVVRSRQNDFDGAEALYEEALAKHPAFPEALSNLSAVRRFKGDLDGAISCCQKALALRPDFSSALNNLGNALKDAGRLEESVAAYRDALRFAPGDANVRNNLAMALLALGEFGEGWREYRWRWKSDHLKASFRNLSEPEWQGEAGEGRTILIHAEQGFGDTIQFCRYAPLVRKRGFNVVMLVPRPLKRLVASLEGVDCVASGPGDIPSFDVQCPMMNLPLAFGTTVATIPQALPYLNADPADAARWRERLKGVGNGALKVGLAWAGRSRAQSPDLIATDRKRSIAPELLAPLLAVPGVQCFSLQKEGPPVPADFPLIDRMADCRDFADTAALIANLDLVIAVDTAVVHLAGALGKPVWLLNRFNNCWRWLKDRDDSPWYPGALRIFRQRTMGDWEEVVERVRDALTEAVAGRTPPAASR